MDPIAEIWKRLEKYPTARIEKGETWIRYLPRSPEGFTVEFLVEDGEYVVAFEGWHERFHDVDEALKCFAFGISDKCRLQIVSRGGTPHKWIVECYRDGEWVADSETGLLLFRFWQSPRVEFRQNTLTETIMDG
jgi:hypothetical protein